MTRRTGIAGSCLAALCLLASAMTPGAAAHEPGGSAHRHGQAPAESFGERIFLGKAGPWDAEARLVDTRAQLEKSGVSPGTAAKFSGKYHLLVILSDPKTKKSPDDAAGQVEISGPDKVSFSKATLFPMGDHIGADVSLPGRGRYRFRLFVQGGGMKGDASFDFERKP